MSLTENEFLDLVDDLLGFDMPHYQLQGEFRKLRKIHDDGEVPVLKNAVGTEVDRPVTASTAEETPPAGEAGATLTDDELAALADSEANAAALDSAIGTPEVDFSSVTGSGGTGASEPAKTTDFSRRAAPGSASGA